MRVQATAAILTNSEQWSKNSLSPAVIAEDLINRAHTTAFLAASYLTDPVCKSHEYFRRLYVVDDLNPTAYKVSHLVHKLFLFGGTVGFACLAVFTTIPGIGLRALALQLRNEPYIYSEGDAEAKSLPKDRSFSLLSWNICGVGAGYSISDRGVLPWAFRLDTIVNKMIEKDADVNCIYEVFDIQSAIYIRDRLKQNGYSYFYYNLGPRAVGLSSGIMVASKYKINNPEFSPFPQDSLVGRTKGVTKGIFAFDLQSKRKSFARIHTTHLQHSEECAYPTDEEIEARRKQMQIIVEKVKRVKGKCVVLTGDLNLDDREYRNSSWRARFQKGDLFKDPRRTWGGDAYCARIVEKRASAPLNLDHTMIAIGTARVIRTTLVETGYEPTQFKREALSDHAGLYSRITV